MAVALPTPAAAGDIWGTQLNTWLNTAVPAINVKLDPYNAKGDGVTNDTSAIQAAVTAALTSTGGRLYFPKGNYLISSALTIPGSSNWVISGDSRGGSIITQSTSNTPIFKVNTTNTNGWSIQDLTMTASSQQAATNLQSAGVWITNSANVFNWAVQRCYFDKLANGVYGDAGTVVWGGTMRDIVVNTQQTRSVIQVVIGGGGMPNNKFENIYIRADSMVGPLFDLSAAVDTWLTGIEVNIANLGPMLIHDGDGGSYKIGSFKVEGATYDASIPGQPLFYIPNGQLIANSIALYTVAANLTGVVFPRNAIFRGDSNPMKVRVDRLDLGAPGSWTITNGTFFVSSASSTSTDIKIDSLDALQTNMQLTSIGLDSSCDQIEVRSWNDGQQSADQGDASVTVTPGPQQPNILSFETNLTAARTVTLPQANAAGNMFNGLRYRVVRSDTGAFALNINNGAGALDNIPSGKKGAIEYTYRRNAWVQTLKALF